MTRSDWDLIAGVIAEELDDWTGDSPDSPVAVFAITVLATKLAVVLSSRSARFSVEKFLERCGIKSPATD